MDMLATIEIRPIQRPTYNNTRIRDYALWLETNILTLTDYWNDLVSEDGVGPISEDDMFYFCLAQYESERDRVAG